NAVASFAVQFAVALGAQVWVTSSSDEKIAKAISQLGAIGGVNNTHNAWKKALWDQLQTSQKAASIFTGNTSIISSDPVRGFDCVIDGSRGDNINDYINMLEQGVRLLFF